MKLFSAAELAKYDGKEGRPAYVAYLGKVFDMTGTEESEHGDHYGHPFGVDLTDAMDDAPHGENLLWDCPEVGRYQPEGRE